MGVTSLQFVLIQDGNHSINHSQNTIIIKVHKYSIYIYIVPPILYIFPLYYMTYNIYIIIIINTKFYVSSISGPNWRYSIRLILHIPITRTKELMDGS